jgi:hypothetical protein
MIRFFFLVGILFSPLVSVFAETESVIPELIVPAPINCNSIYTINWPEQVKVGSTHEYYLTSWSGSDFSGSVTYVLRRDKKVVEMIQDREKYLRYFSTPGEVILDAKINIGENSCEGNIIKKIRVYNSVITYIGSERFGVETGIRDVFDKNNILYKSYIDTNSISKFELSQDIWSSIDQSDIFIIWNSDILWFFSDIVRLQKTKQISFIKKKIYVISDFSRSLLSKVLASSLSQIGATRVYLISNDQFYGLVTRVSTGLGNEWRIWQEISYEKSNTVYSLNSFIEFLAYAWFSYQLLALLLSITFVVLILNVLKQVIGFNVFGIYYPILFAITVASFGISAFIFIAIAFLSIVIVNSFSNKVHLLLHAKRALLISLYIALFLFILGIDNFFELSLINYTIFDNPLIIFPLFTTIILSDKIFQEDINMFGRSGFIDIVQYGIITFIIYQLIEYKTLQYFLISYPDVIIIVVFLNIIVGRYMGLQLFEYFRFSPLLRKLNEEE